MGVMSPRMERAFHDVPALWHEARPCAAVNSDGSLAKQQLETVAAYYAALAHARSVLGFRG